MGSMGLEGMGFYLFAQGLLLQCKVPVTGRMAQRQGQVVERGFPACLRGLG